MAIVNTGMVAKALWPGVNQFFGMGYNEYAAEYPEIFTTYNSNKNFEEDVDMYGLGLAQVKDESANIAYDVFGQGPTKRYVHVVYGLGYIVTREHVEDNQYVELATNRAKMLAFSMRQTKENVGANILNRAFNGSYVGADGLELCSTAHLLTKGGTYANELVTSADLSEASLEQAAIDLMGLTNGAGLKVTIMPRKLIVPKELTFEAERILKTTLQVNSANNTLNALRSKGIFPEGYAVNHFLTDTDAFFLLTNCPNGLKHFQRRAAAMDNDSDFDSENIKFKATERYSFGWSDPRGIFGSPGA